MKQNKFIELKAAFLLTVFALNTVLAFACSLGLNMGYNDNHHTAVKVQPVTGTRSYCHTPVSKLHHHNTPAAKCYDNNANQSHYSKHLRSDDATPSRQQEKGSSNDDDCCTNTAVKFQTEDKKLQQSQNVAIKAPVFVVFLSAFLGLHLKQERATTARSYPVTQFYPPPDIRVVIQSFLI